MALKKRNGKSLGTFKVGATAIVAGQICNITASLLVAATDGSAFPLVAKEAGDVGAFIAVAEIGEIIDVNAHDADVAEMEAIVAAAAGRADGAAAWTGGTQWIAGISLQAASAQDQKISMLYLPQIATDAAS